MCQAKYAERDGSEVVPRVAQMLKKAGCSCIDDCALVGGWLW
jgi:hypothetical protein